MKKQFFALPAFCLLALSFAPRPAPADAPQPGTLSVTLINSTVSLGEPILLKYRISELDYPHINFSTGDSQAGWLRMSMRDSAGLLTPMIPEPAPRRNGIHANGGVAEANGDTSMTVVVTQSLQPTHAGQYRLNLATHFTYFWRNGGAERYSDDQSRFLTVTVTDRDPKRLHTVAESLRQRVLTEPDISDAQLATQELFSMRDPEVLPVWRALATDPSLDAWRASEVINQLRDIGTITTTDILAQMQVVAPERWAQTGYSPLDGINELLYSGSPEVKRHLPQIYTKLGITLTKKPTVMRNG